MLWASIWYIANRISLFGYFCQSSHSNTTWSHTQTLQVTFGEVSMSYNNLLAFCKFFINHNSLMNITSRVPLMTKSTVNHGDQSTDTAWSELSTPDLSIYPQIDMHQERRIMNKIRFYANCITRGLLCRVQKLNWFVPFPKEKPSIACTDFRLYVCIGIFGIIQECITSHKQLTLHLLKFYNTLE